MRLRVYIAGPYTQGDVVQNVQRAISVADQVLQAGHSPYVPHLDHYWHEIYPHDYLTWITLGMDWLKVCDAVIRLEGESRGADIEVATAIDQLGIPVYKGVDEFLNAVKE